MIARLMATRLGLLMLGGVLLNAACARPAGSSDGAPAAGAASGPITVYSGRAESLVGPLLERFTKETGIEVRARYGDTAELAAALLEEGKNSPADVFFAQDAGALGALAQKGLFAKLSDNVLNRVESRFRSPQGLWVGASGRARTVVYNTDALGEQDLPDSIFGFTDGKWRGRIGWVPTNGSFQAFVTALRLTEGEPQTTRWLEGIKANSPKGYANNTAAVRAVASREVDVAFVNHYYLYAIQKDQGPIPVRNYHPRDGKAGAMINVAGAGLLTSSKNSAAARQFIDYLLGRSAQEYFVTETFEYPLVAGAGAPAGATPLVQIASPNIDLGNLADLDATLRLLRTTGVL